MNDPDLAEVSVCFKGDWMIIKYRFDLDKPPCYLRVHTPRK